MGQKQQQQQQQQRQLQKPKLTTYMLAWVNFVMSLT